MKGEEQGPSRRERGSKGREKVSWKGGRVKEEGEWGGQKGGGKGQIKGREIRRKGDGAG